MPNVIQPEKVLRDLHELWDQLGREQTSAGGVLRACAMTLLVIAGDESDAEQVRRTIGVLMHDHPSRAILLRIAVNNPPEMSTASGDPGAAAETSGAPESSATGSAAHGNAAGKVAESSATGSGATNINEMSARVFAECWMPFSGNQQICAEGIEITAGTAELADAARVLVPLIVPDLPVVLWCRSRNDSPLAAMDTPQPDAFEPLFRLAGKIIFDSSAAADPGAAIRALQTMRRSGRRVADLAWTRLTGWREVIANGCQDASWSADQISSVRIQFGGTAPAAAVRYFTAWIEQALPSARVTTEPVPGEPGLRSVILSAAGSETTIALTDSSSVEVRAGARSAGAAKGCRSLLPPVSDDALMREELSILDGDPVFDRVLMGFR